MHRNRLNLAALRNRALAKNPHESVPALARCFAAGLTRRELLGIAGGAAVGLLPLAKAADQASRGQFALKSGPDWFAFSLNGKERWRVEARQFAGASKLSIEQTDQLINIALSNSRYPGTDIPADFSCTLKKGVTGWSMAMAMPQFKYTGQAAFERWLLGAESLRSRSKVASTDIHLREGARLCLSGITAAEYVADGTLSLMGAAGIALIHDSAKFLGDAISLSIPQRSDMGVLARNSAKRTRLAMPRGTNSWNASALMPPVLPDALKAGDDHFSALMIESAEDAAGARRHALLAVSSPESTDMRFHAAHQETAPYDGANHLPLTRVQTAIAYDDRGDHYGLTAHIKEGRHWIHTSLGSFQVEGHPEEPLSLTSRAGEKHQLDFAPLVHTTAIGLPGATSEPASTQIGTRLRFAVDEDSPADAAGGPAVHVSNGTVNTVTLTPGVPIGIIRPIDMLVLRFTFDNLSLTGGKLVVTDIRYAAYVTITFPPQQIADQAFFELDPNYGDGTGNESPSVPVDQRAAGASRLVFYMPKAVTSIPFNLSSLLTSLTQFPPSVADTALAAPVITPYGSRAHAAASTTTEEHKALRPLRSKNPYPSAAAEKKAAATTESGAGASPAGYPLWTLSPYDPATSPFPITALEIPWRLVLSPSFLGGWTHSNDPVTFNGRTELWHTRLGVRLDSSGNLCFNEKTATVDETADTAYERILRAIWSPDRNFPYDPFRMSLSSDDRRQLVGLMADYTLNNGADFRYADVNRLMLTSLGAWIDSRYTNEPPNGSYSLQEWDHRAAMGRDYYVRVIYKGYLFPFGHDASLVKITERKFQRDSDRGYRAYLRQHFYIIVRQPEVTYPDLTTSAFGRKAGFRKVRITTKVTPNLADPTSSTSSVAGLGQKAFWPQVLDSATGGIVDFKFHLIGEDSEGNTTDFVASLIFVDNTQNTQAQLNTVAYSNSNGYYTSGARRLSSMTGQQISFTPANSAAPGATRFAVDSIAFGVQTPSIAFGPDDPRFYPAFDAAQIRVAALEQLSGRANSPQVVRFAQNYLDNYFGGANKGEVVLELLSPNDLLSTSPFAIGQQFGFPTDKSGGLASPNLVITGLSRTKGPVGGSVAAGGPLSAGQFDPSDFFSGVFDGANLLGGVKLTDILRLAGLGGGPELLRKTFPDKIVVSYDWNTTALQSDPLGLFVPTGIHGGNASFSLSAVITANIPKSGTPQPPTYDIEGSLKTFQINLFSFIIIGFDEFSFSAKTGKKVDVSPKIADDGIQFGGPLEFINELKNYIPTQGFSDPPVLDVSPTGVTAGYTLAIPSIGIGVFSLENITLSAMLTIPFTGQPIRFRFAFCTREHPFTLTVSLFGGGGFFGIALGVDGVETLEASLEFGGNFSIDLGVASGGVHIMAGIYFKWEKNATQLTAYLRLGGELNVLGIISVSLEFYLSLSYTSDGTLAGEASLKVEIDILFFSASVSVTVHKVLSKGSGVSPNALPAGSDVMLEDNGAGAVPGAIANPPRFVDLITSQTVWNAYASAFA